MTCEKKKHVEQMLLSLIKRNDYGCKSTNYSAYRPYKTYFFFTCLHKKYNSTTNIEQIQIHIRYLYLMFQSFDFPPGLKDFS